MIYDGKKIAELRRQAGLKQVQLARKSGISQPSLWAIEHEVTKEPAAKTLFSIANALSVDIRLLLKKPTGKPADLLAEMADTFQQLDDLNKVALIAAAKAMLQSGKK